MNNASWFVWLVGRVWSSVVNFHSTQIGHIVIEHAVSLFMAWEHVSIKTGYIRINRVLSRSTVRTANIIKHSLHTSETVLQEVAKNFCVLSFSILRAIGRNKLPPKKYPKHFWRKNLVESKSDSLT